MCSRLHTAGTAPDRITPQAADRKLSQMEERAATAGDQTLTSAVITGRRALAEWQGLAGLRDLEGEYECLALGESRALARLQGVLELLDTFVEPPVAAAPGFLAVRMLGAFELEIDGRPVTHWRGQRTQSLMQFLTAHRHRSVPRDELITAVWPDTDEDSGRHRLAPRPSMNCVGPCMPSTQAVPRRSAVTADTGSTMMWPCGSTSRNSTTSDRPRSRSASPTGSPTGDRVRPAGAAAVPGRFPVPGHQRGLGHRRTQPAAGPLRPGQHPCGRPARQTRGTCRGAGRG